MTAGRDNISLNKNWCTPKKYVDAVNIFFNNQIELDPCSNIDSIINTKIKYILPTDGLKEHWNYRTIYVNPPYGKDKEKNTTIKNWLRKCVEANEKCNSEVIALIPVATNTTHWKEYVWNKALSICFLYDTRLKFRINGNENNKGSPMACCIVYWGFNYKRFNDVFNKYGKVVNIKYHKFEV
jgi:hypothetical protein